MEWWTGMAGGTDWNRMVEWNGTLVISIWWSPLYKDHLLTKTTSLYRLFTLMFQMLLSCCFRVYPHRMVLLITCTPHA